eukprot:2007984-Pleurochrysis_carterae.AAC.2
MLSLIRSPSQNEQRYTPHGQINWADARARAASMGEPQRPKVNRYAWCASRPSSGAMMRRMGAP